MKHDPRPVLDARWVIHAGLTAIRTLVQTAPRTLWSSIIWGATCVGIIGMVTPNLVIGVFSIGVINTVHGAMACFLLRAGATMLPGVLALNALQGYHLVWRRARAGI